MCNTETEIMSIDSKHQSDLDLITKAQSVAKSLTYNESQIQAEAKHLLYDLTNRLSRKCTRVGRNDSSLAVFTLTGHFRYLTLRECFLYKLFNVTPEIE